MTPQSISRILAKAGHVKTLGKQLTHQFRPGFAVFWSSDQISIRVKYVEDFKKDPSPELDLLEQEQIDRYKNTLQGEGYEVVRERTSLVVRSKK